MRPVVNRLITLKAPLERDTLPIRRHNQQMRRIRSETHRAVDPLTRYAVAVALVMNQRCR